MPDDLTDTEEAALEEALRFANKFWNPETCSVQTFLKNCEAVLRVELPQPVLH